jgi:REP element-mobilizing transposase RayT
MPGFDYRTPGPYVMTICTYRRQWRFGLVTPECEMESNAAGRMVAEIWKDIPNQFPTVTLDAFVVMPNHIHGILQLDAADIDRNPDIADVIGWFKTVTTNRYIWGVRAAGWPRFDRHVWQRDYFEHVVRNDIELTRYREYIANNPTMWAIDKYALPL